MNTKAKKNIKNLSFFAKYKSQRVNNTSKEHVSANNVCIYITKKPIIVKI